MSHKILQKTTIQILHLPDMEKSSGRFAKENKLLTFFFATTFRIYGIYIINAFGPQNHENKSPKVVGSHGSVMDRCGSVLSSQKAMLISHATTTSGKWDW